MVWVSDHNQAGQASAKCVSLPPLCGGQLAG